MTTHEQSFGQQCRRHHLPRSTGDGFCTCTTSQRGGSLNRGEDVLVRAAAHFPSAALEAGATPLQVATWPTAGPSAGAEIRKFVNKVWICWWQAGSLGSTEFPTTRASCQKGRAARDLGREQSRSGLGRSAAIWSRMREANYLL